MCFVSVSDGEAILVGAFTRLDLESLLIQHVLFRHTPIHVAGSKQDNPITVIVRAARPRPGLPEWGTEGTKPWVCQ
jgi:hypothetical protein